MALVIPYGDTQAHGSIGDALSFRRWRGRVILEKKPHPRQPNTPPQIEWRERFRLGWKAFHSLDAWTLEYVTQKAAELDRTPANFFLSQWLLDEVPSNIPMNNIKQVTEISLPEPVASEDHGISFKPHAVKDDPAEEWLLGTIFDKENIFTPGVTAGDHTRMRIEIKRDFAPPLSIPFNYPAVVKWNDFNDVPHINLMRFPLLTLPVSEEDPSTDPMTDVKEVTSLQLITKIGQKGQDVLINFQYWKDAGPEHESMAWIEDRDDIFGKGASMAAYDNLYVTFREWINGQITLPPGYAIYIEYKDQADNPQSKAIYFPETPIDERIDSSNLSSDSWETGVAAELLPPAGLDPFELTYYFFVHIHSGPGGAIIGTISDNQNIFNPSSAIRESHNHIMLLRPIPGIFSVPYGQKLRFTWKDNNNIEYTHDFFLPNMYVEYGTPRYLYVAKDMTLYWDPEFTNQAYPRQTRSKKLWFSDDWSIYWDKGMTQLARSNAWGSKKLWLADDFSLYWDEAMTQLANTPYF